MFVSPLLKNANNAAKFIYIDLRAKLIFKSALDLTLNF